MAASPDRRWLALALISAVQFMVVLDIAIVNVALPSIKVDLGFSQENLQWVISAYALAFGGFLLLGGIFTDLLSWEWIFYINVPVAMAALALTPVLLAESRDARGQGFDALGAVLVTSGLSTSVFAITKANDYGWTSAMTLALFA